VLLGDGELNEGMIWEAASFAAHHRLGNLLAIVDRNSMQCLGSTADILDMGSLTEKFRAFGWTTKEVDGHDHGSILAALGEREADEDRPFALLAHTTKGKGVTFMEGSVEWHHQRLTQDEFHAAMNELGENEG